MKKLLLVSLLLFVTYGMVYSTDLLELVSPNGGESWQIGSEKKIRWDADDSVTNNVRLILFRNGTRVGLIAKNLSPRPGVYTWEKVGQYEGGTAKAGPGYKIVIKEERGTAKDQSAKPFSLFFSGKHDLRPIPIKVTEPKKGDRWYVDQIRMIQWESILKPPFKVELYNESKVFVMECKPIPSTGNRPTSFLPKNKYKLAWRVRDIRVLYGYYYIRVSKGAVYGFSGKFTIQPLDN
jgi:hypothetical protein